MFLIINFILIAFLHLFDCHLNNLLLIISTSSLGWRSRLIHPQVHHKECDPSVVLPAAYPLISIHALTRSATAESTLSSCAINDFNPRTHKECDCEFSINFIICLLFQSTHSQGVRRCVLIGDMLNFLFQSTHSQGVRRLSNLIFADMALISIHALTRSATSRVYNDLRIQSIFQSTHSQGVRLQKANKLKPDYLISIHALTRSATFFVPSEKLNSGYFNPRTHKECD